MFFRRTSTWIWLTMFCRAEWVSLWHWDVQLVRLPLYKDAFTPDTCSPDTTCITRRRLYVFCIGDKIVFNAQHYGDMYPLVSRYKLLVRDTCIRLCVSGVNAAFCWVWFMTIFWREICRGFYYGSEFFYTRCTRTCIFIRCEPYDPCSYSLPTSELYILRHNFRRVLLASLSAWLNSWI